MDQTVKLLGQEITTNLSSFSCASKNIFLEQGTENWKCLEFLNAIKIITFANEFFTS